MASAPAPFERLEAAHYGAILADPPWRFETWSDKGKGRSAERHYKTMSFEEICELPVASLAKRDAALFLWATWPLLEDALDVMRVWGFTYKTCGFCWMKVNSTRSHVGPLWQGTGYWTRANTEVCLLATRGHPRRKHADVPQALLARRREHSRKPPTVHARIRRLVGGPYLELFARERRPGWAAWGNEVR